MKTRHTDEQITFAMKQTETGTSVAEVIARMGISEQTFYRWKKVYGGLGVGELRRLKLVEEENRRDSQDFCVRAGIKGTRSPPYVVTHRTDDTTRAAGPVAGGWRGKRCR